MTQVNLTIDLNKNRGGFSGEFNLTEAVNSFYTDYSGVSISLLSVSANPKLGAVATVRILGGSIGVNPFPSAWHNFGDPITTNTSEYNILTIMYVGSDDIRIVNNISAVRETYADILSNFAKLALDSTQIDLSNATNVRTSGADKFLINWIDQSPLGNNANQPSSINQFQLDLTDKFLIQGGNDFITCGVDTNFSGSTGFSAYFVLDKNNSDDLQVIMGRKNNSGINVFSQLSGANYIFKFYNGASGLEFIVPTAADLLGKKIFEVHHDGAGNAELLINGVSKDTLTGAANADWIVDIIGRRDAGNYLTGSIYGIFNFSHLSSIERLTVRQELASKYNISL